MITPRETIYAALFAQLQSALTPTFKTVSRRWQPPDQISPADRPALYQVETGEIAATSQKIAGLGIIWNLKLDLVIYSSGNTDPGSTPSQELNALLDAVEAALRNLTIGSPQSLGGKVYNARIDGKLEIVENVAGAIAMAVVPVVLVQGA
jgi:hypothetical protein